jgi:hypothetical protein
MPPQVMPVLLLLYFAVMQIRIHILVLRLAPLSEGRIEPKDGSLMCSYHGEVLTCYLMKYYPDHLYGVWCMLRFLLLSHLIRCTVDEERIGLSQVLSMRTRRKMC